MHAPSVHSEPLESLVVKRQHDNDDAQPRGYHAIMNTVLLAAIAVICVALPARSSHRASGAAFRRGPLPRADLLADERAG